LARFQAGNWYGIVVPVKTPREIVERLHKASLATLNNPVVNKRLVDLGFVLIGSTSEEFGAYFRTEIDTWARIVKELKLTAD
jgi:tripartite-type tricarboxylate transporter receptor subunit TctC